MKTPSGAPLRRCLHHPATAWLILLASLMLTLVAWRISNDAVSKRTAERFGFQVADVTVAIQNRMVEYQAVLRSGIGLFQASDEVGRGEWKTFVETLAVERYYPGIQGIGFSRVIPPGGIAAHEAAMRKDLGPQYRHYPAGERETRTAIVYLEPLDFRNRRAIGYDMFSEPVRRLAMERARDTGEAALSGMVTLVQETDTDIQKGFLLYLPLYARNKPTSTVEERRKALVGWVYSPFRVEDLMHGILGTDQDDVSFELFDGPDPSPQTLLYDYDGDGGSHFLGAGPRPKFTSVSQINVGGHVWTMFLHSQPGYLSAADVSQPLVVAFGGVTIDILLFLIIASISRQKVRAQRLADAMTADLRQKNEDLEQFTHVLAHHMQEPTRLQHVYCQRLESLLPGALSPEAAQAVEFIKKGALRQRALLRDVGLYLSVRREPPPEWPSDTAAALDAALLRLREPVAARMAEIHRGTLPPAFMTMERLTELFAILVENAIVHHPQDRPPVIAIDGWVEGGNAFFSVSDSGTGIPATFRSRVFQVFERLDPKPGAHGTGIGLALAKKIIDSSQGGIWIDQSTTGGAKITFSIPNP